MPAPLKTQPKTKKWIGNMRRFALLTLLVMGFTACTQNTIDEASNAQANVKHIYATFEQNTRVELNEEKQTVWTEGDRIVRFANGVHDVWEFAGETGDKGGTFNYIGYFDDGINFDFGDKYYALYSYENYGWWGTFNTGEPALFHYVRTDQSYKPNTYDPASNIMLAVSEDSENFEFVNLMGYLRISLTGEKRVSQIVLKGNNNEALSGRRYVKYNDYSVYGWYDNLYSYISLSCGEEGVQLTDTPTYFYFTVAPTTFLSGIDISVEFTDGTTFPIKTMKEINIERNHIQPMANVYTGSGVEWQTITIKHTGDTMATPWLMGASNLAGYIYWGDGWMSKINLLTSYVFRDASPEHEVTVKALNANYMYITDCSGVSEIDFSNF